MMEEGETGGTKKKNDRGEKKRSSESTVEAGTAQKHTINQPSNHQFHENYFKMSPLSIYQPPRAP